MKILLEKWAAQNFDPPPSKATLNRLARDGKIPNCEKFGGRWYVQQDKLSPLTEKILSS